MILCDKDIKERLGKSILLEPFETEQIGSSNVDLRLGYEFRVFKHVAQTHIDPYEKQDAKQYTELHTIKDGEPFTIHPGEFVLATTYEKVSIPADLVASIDGRSSLGRLGIIIQTAAMIDAGFEGQITLELANIGKMPVNIYPKMRICRMTFHRLTQECENPYNGKYKNQIPAAGSNIEADKEFTE